MVLYINKYFEVNLNTSTNTTFYYLGDRLVAMSENTTLKYLHQAHLTGTALMTNNSDAQIGTTVKYMPFEENGKTGEDHDLNRG